MTSRELDEPLEPESRHAPNAGELRKILRQIRDAQHETNRRLTRQEHLMADLSTAESDLAAAVNVAVTDLSTGNQALKDALAQAQSDLAAAQAVDASDVAARDDALAKLAASQADVQAAADSMETQVSALNAATGTTPPAPAA